MMARCYAKVGVGVLIHSNTAAYTNDHAKNQHAQRTSLALTTSDLGYMRVQLERVPY